MKISHAIRSIYNSRTALSKLLETKVKEIFESKKKPQWFYTSRVKSLESFAQKLETGRVSLPGEMEDLFACTLVVENRRSISEALRLIEEEFVVSEQRPRDGSITHKSPDSFPFDDLRLYVSLKENEALPSTPIHDIKFEIQIKTFLQHAWGIATHDMIYKGESIDWSRARIAYQIKAMLEHAEISVEQVDSLAASSGLAMSDFKTKEKKAIIEWLIKTWPSDLLPKDLVRLSETIGELCFSLRIKFDDLTAAIVSSTAENNGANLTDASPYATILKAVYNKFNEPFLSYLKSPPRPGKRFMRIFVSDDPEILSALKNCHPEKYIYLGRTES